MSDKEDQTAPVQENPRKLSKSVLDSFQKLSYNLDKFRIEGGTSLIKHLGSQQKIANGEKSKELTYAVQRLVRGLGSSKIEARNGFYSTLVALLKYFSEITPDDIMNSVNKELMIAQNQSKAELADIYTGQILARGVLIRSGRFSDLTYKSQNEHIAYILKIAKRRSYLPLLVYTFIIELLNKIELKSFKKGVWPSLKPYICIEWTEHSLETLLCILSVEGKFSELLQKENIELSANSLPLIAKLFFYETNPTHILNHPALELIARRIGRSPEMVTAFWADDCLGLYLTETNRHHDTIAASLWNQCVKHLTDNSWLVFMLQPHVIKFLLRHRQEKGQTATLLSAIANSLDVPNVAEETLLQVFQRLVRDKPGSPNIEEITGVRFLPRLTNRLQINGVMQLANWYQEMMESDRHIKERIAACYLFTKLLGHPSLKDNIKWRAEKISWIFKFAFVQNKKENLPGLIKIMKENFFRSVGQSNKASQSQQLLSLITTNINEFIKSNTLGEPLDDKCLAEWERTYMTLSKLTFIINLAEDKESSDVSTAVHFHMLLAHLVLYLFSDSALALDAIQELHSCIEHSQLLGGTVKGGDEKKDTDSPHWTEVITELHLSLLSTDQAILRKLVTNAFRYMCPHLSSGAKRSLIQAINLNETLNDNDDEESDNSDLDSNTEELNVEKMDQEDSSVQENEEEEEEADDDDEGDNDEGKEEADDDDELVEEEEEPIMEEFRIAVQDALGTVDNTSDVESVDMDKVLDEEGAKKLDEALSAAFKAYRPSNSKSTNKNSRPTQEQIALVHFRIRVLDLISTYLGHEPDLHWCLELIKPLLDLYEHSITKEKIRDRPLELRITSLLKHLGQITKFSNVNSVSQTQLIKIFKSLILDSRTSSLYEELVPHLQNIINFLIGASNKIAEEPGKENFKNVLVNIFDERYPKRGEGSIPDRLYWWLMKCRRCPWIVFQLVQRLAKHAFNLSGDTNLRPFKRTLAMQLINTAFTHQAFDRETEEYHQFEKWLWEHTTRLLSQKNQHS